MYYRLVVEENKFSVVLCKESALYSTELRSSLGSTRGHHGVCFTIL